MSTPADRPANALARETSPYLLQHAYNPVAWEPWGEAALQRAQTEDKPIIVSIGYSACHWCHVMERESFENEALAALMNEHFVCIKVDREERPDVDQVYMEAVQAMGQQGGWPLNVFLTPVGEPFYGGTYFPPAQWEQTLRGIAQAYEARRGEITDAARDLTRHLQQSELTRLGLTDPDANFQLPLLDRTVAQMAQRFDGVRGGMNRAPKFPMPTLYTFLLRYGHLAGAAQREAARQHAERTLVAMAHGGLYDQLGGGFARYAVDADWFAPHFEKMLYDNGQLVSLYAEAFVATQNPLFARVVEETIDFVQRELTAPEGGFYAALDADSEGEEGKFYVWTYAELRDLLGDELPLFAAYYGVTEAGNWEEGQNILHLPAPESETAERFGVSADALREKVVAWRKQLRSHRDQRSRPGLDDKILTGWNALMLTGLADAYRVFGQTEYLAMARRNAAFLRDHLRDGTRLFRNYKNGRATLDASLEDYALLVRAYVALYQASFEPEWLRLATELTEHARAHFFDDDEGLFYFTPDYGEKLVARKKELFDNVIPASNSVMAHNLYDLSLLLDRADWGETARQMLARVSPLLEGNGQYAANWATLYARLVRPTAEVAIVGPTAEAERSALDQHYHPNKVVAGSNTPTDYPSLLAHRAPAKGGTALYVCYQRTCQQPVHRAADAVKQLQQAESS